MSKADYFLAVKTGKPYFGPYKTCRKSWSHIYWYQQKLIKYISLKTKIDQINILEIGSWAGASSFSWCEGIDRYFKRCGSIVCVDIWNSHETKSKSNIEAPYSQLRKYLITIYQQEPILTW
jgi:hypothetical protein